MAEINTQSTLVGLYKEIYAGKIVKAWSFMAKVADRVRFIEAERQNGKFYNQPVDLVFEHGITAAGAGVTPGAAGAPFLPPSAGQMETAQLAGTNLIGRSQIAYEAISRSMNDKGAFEKATTTIVARLSQAVVKRLELQLLHGKMGLGTIAANPATGTSRTVTITDASWGAGIWAGEVGSTLDLYDLVGTKVSTGSTATSNAIIISSINTVNKTLTLSTPQASDQTLNLANLRIHFETSGPASEMAGLSYILDTNPSTPDLFGISPTAYDLWCSNQVPGVGALSFGKITGALAAPATYGLSQRVVAVMSPKAFEVVNTEQAALRQYDDSYKPSESKNGSQSLVFLCQTGEIEMLSHPFAKDGEILIFVPKESVRVGSQDVDFITRDGGEKLILESATAAATEMRCYSNQALFISMPRHCVKMTGITY